MIRRKCQSRKNHIFDVFLFSGVILCGLQYFEICIKENDEIFRVLVALDIFFFERHGLVVPISKIIMLGVWYTIKTIPCSAEVASEFAREMW
jgi:hypothetical protein